MASNNTTNGSEERTSLFDEFPPVSRQRWEEEVESDLKGADYKDKFTWHPAEGIDLLPFYREKDMDELPHLGSKPGHPPYVRGTDADSNEWEIRQNVYSKGVSDANAEALEALEKGANSINFTALIDQKDGTLSGLIQGVAIQNQDDFSNVLKDIPLDRVAIHFNAGLASPALVAMLHNEVQKQGCNPEYIEGTLLYDPISFIAVNGQEPKKETAWLQDMKQMVDFCAENLPNLKCAGIDLRHYHNAGASVVQEVAFALAIGTDYLSRMTEQSLPVELVAPRMHFNFSIGSSYFLEIAKYRAARMLWARVLEQFDADLVDELGMYIHAQTSNWNKTLYDPHTNMLRSTTEAMAAAISGCDAITVDPYDHTFKSPDKFSKRIARNQQIILQEESYFDNVVDPAAGSYYIEQLTDAVARESWNVFQSIEDANGFLRSLYSGKINNLLEETSRKRDQEIARRKQVFVGTNQYPDPENKMLEKIDEPFEVSDLAGNGDKPSIQKDAMFESLSTAFAEGALLGDVMSELFMFNNREMKPIKPYRGPQQFEKLRLATEMYEQENDSVPTAYMLPIGHRKMRKARATFSSNFLGCAGYEIIEPIGFDSVKEAADELKEHEPDMIVLCSSDQEYPDMAEELEQLLNELSLDPILILAGAPGEQEKHYRKHNINYFIHRRSNVLETLQELHERLGISS